MNAKECTKFIINNPNPRSDLSQARSFLADLHGDTDAVSGDVFPFIQPDFLEKLLELLEHEDAKTRKNAALLLGDLARWLSSEETRIPLALYQSYKKEETKFVKSSYLKALAFYDCDDFLEDLLKEREQLLKLELAPEEQKHAREILAAIEKIVSSYEEMNYTFLGFKKKHPILLLAEDYIAEEVLKEVNALGYPDAKLTRGGIRLTTDSLDTIKDIRTYQDILVGIRLKKDMVADETHLAETIAASELLPLLEEVYGKLDDYTFSIDGADLYMKKRHIITKDGKEKALDLAKIAGDIQLLSKGRLINRNKNAAVWLHLARKKDGNYLIYGKFTGRSDGRFSYRKQSLPTSTNPLISAQMISLIGPYLQEGAHVIDPFCGTGTLLIERMLFGRTQDVYGVDTFGEAIAIATESSYEADKKIYFINRNYFDFTLDYIMEEVITEFPHMENAPRDEVDSFYKNFFDKTSEITATGSMIFFLSTEDTIVKKQLRLHSDFGLIRTIPMRKKEQIYIISKRG